MLVTQIIQSSKTPIVNVFVDGSMFNTMYGMNKINKEVVYVNHFGLLGQI